MVAEVGLAGLGLLDDLLEQIDVMGEGRSASGGEGAGRQRAAFLEALGDGDVPGLLEGAEMKSEVAVRHLQRVADLGERYLWIGGQHGHNGQASFFVDDAVKL